MKYRCPKCTNNVKIKKRNIPKTCPYCNFGWDRELIKNDGVVVKED